MAEKSIYRITVKNFNKHNSHIKKGHKSTLIANNFCTDGKLGVLPLSVRWMFLGLILACGDNTSDTIEMNVGQLRDILPSSIGVDSGLDQLQELQLLSYEKINLFINRIEKKVIEKNGKELSSVAKKSSLPSIIKAEKVSIKISDEKFVEVSKALMTSWSETFPKEFLSEEFQKARNWLLANPHKAPRSNYGRFLNNWFNTGWERYRKTLTGAPAVTTVEQLNDILGVKP